jgi:hypothetical protein
MFKEEELDETVTISNEEELKKVLRLVKKRGK